MHESLSIPYKPFPLKKTVTAIKRLLGVPEVAGSSPASRSAYAGVVQLVRTPLYRKNPVLKKYQETDKKWVSCQSIWCEVPVWVAVLPDNRATAFEMVNSHPLSFATRTKDDWLVPKDYGLNRWVKADGKVQCRCGFDSFPLCGGKTTQKIFLDFSKKICYNIYVR